MIDRRRSWPLLGTMTVRHEFHWLAPLLLASIVPGCDGKIALDDPQQNLGSGSEGGSSDDGDGGTGNGPGSGGSSGAPTCGEGDGIIADDAPAAVPLQFTLRNDTAVPVLVPGHRFCGGILEYVWLEAYFDDADTPPDVTVYGHPFPSCGSAYDTECSDPEAAVAGCDGCAAAAPLLLQPGAQFTLEWDRLWYLDWIRPNACEGDAPESYACTHRGAFAGDDRATAEVHAIEALDSYCGGAPCVCPDGADACVLDSVDGESVQFQEDLTWTAPVVTADVDEFLIPLGP